LENETTSYNAGDTDGLIRLGWRCGLMRKVILLKAIRLIRLVTIRKL